MHPRDVFMERVRIALLLLAAAFICGQATRPGRRAFVPTARAAAAVASAELLGELPPELRGAGAALLGEADERERARLAARLAAAHPAGSLDFLVALLERESSAFVRARIVSALGARRDPKVAQALERRLEAGAEPSDEVAGLAFRRLLDRQQYALPGPLSLGNLAGEKERVRVLVFGDFGSGSQAQRQVAEDMLAYHRQSPFDLGLTVGDNFYPSGLSSPVHPRWQTQWEELYTPLGIKFYAILGNHDRRDSASPYAQVLRTKRSESWRMPAPFYTFRAGPAQFFALDTNNGHLDSAQLEWLADELKKSDATWKIVYGHHPFKSDGEHGDDQYTRKMRALLLPVLLEGKADLYLAGHDHDMQYLKPEGGLYPFVSGGGGKGHRALRTPHHRRWGRSTFGFTVLEAEGGRLAVEFVGPGVEPLCRVEISKHGETQAFCP
jgi:tartrate-resistant acid phosphatase type 5